jgi:hypothetical protein
MTTTAQTKCTSCGRAYSEIWNVQTHEFDCAAVREQEQALATLAMPAMPVSKRAYSLGYGEDHDDDTRDIFSPFGADQEVY